MKLGASESVGKWNIDLKKKLIIFGYLRMFVFKAFCIFFCILASWILILGCLLVK
jgi:hypothetical protein